MDRRQHVQYSVTTLPSRIKCSTFRGAEQGDVLGVIQSAQVLGSEDHMQARISSPFALNLRRVVRLNCVHV